MCFNHNFFFSSSSSSSLFAVAVVVVELEFGLHFVFVDSGWSSVSIVLCDYYAPQLHFTPFTFQIKFFNFYSNSNRSIPIPKTCICSMPLANHSLSSLVSIHRGGKRNERQNTKHFVKCYSSPT